MTPAGDVTPSDCENAVPVCAEKAPPGTTGVVEAGVPGAPESFTSVASSAPALGEPQPVGVSKPAAATQDAQLPLLPSTTSVKAAAYVAAEAAMVLYSVAWKSPSNALEAATRRAFATATRPAHCGAPMLVPPYEFHEVLVAPCSVSATYWPVAGLALKATSDVARILAAPAPGITVPDCHVGRVSTLLTA